LAEFSQWKFSAWRSPKKVDARITSPLIVFQHIFEKSSRESVGIGCFITWHLVDGTPNFLLRERLINASQIRLLEVELIPTKVMGARISPRHDRLEVGLNDWLLSPMLSDPTLVVLEALNMIFPSSCINSHMEKYVGEQARRCASSLLCWSKARDST
jgi:hypothetical protein